MTFYPTFSKLGLAHHCVYPWTSGTRWPRLPPSTFATFGSAVSQAAECIAVWGEAPVDAIAAANELSEADRKRLGYAAFHVGELLTAEAETDSWRKAETALAYDLRRRTGRELPRRHARDYSARRQHELVGTPDLVRLTGAGELVVRDWKTGRYRVGARPFEDHQLRALALAAARTYGHDAVVVELAQVDEHGVHIEQNVLDVFDLDEIHVELCAMAERIEAQPIPVPGRWCSADYCPIVSECPATQRALEAVHGMVELKHPLSAQLTDLEHAAYVYERVAAVEAAVKAIREALKAFAEHEPIPAGNGKVYAQVEKTRKTIDLTPEGVMALSKYGAADAIEQSVTRAALKRAVKSHAPRGKAAALERELMAALDEMGCVRESSYRTFTEIKPKKEDAA